MAKSGSKGPDDPPRKKATGEPLGRKPSPKAPKSRPVPSKAKAAPRAASKPKTKASPKPSARIGAKSIGKSAKTATSPRKPSGRPPAAERVAGRVAPTPAAGLGASRSKARRAPVESVAEAVPAPHPGPTTNEGRPGRRSAKSRASEPVVAPPSRPSAPTASAAPSPGAPPLAPVPPLGAPSRPAPAPELPAASAPTPATPPPAPRASPAYPDVPLAASPARPIPTHAFVDEEGWTEVEAEELEDDRPRTPRAPPPPAAGGEEGWEPIAEDEIPLASKAAAPREAPREAPRHAPTIPPLPDEDDVFEPIEDDGPPREPPPGATPHMVLTAVRRGQLHVSALNAVSDEMLEALADDAGLELVAGERRAEIVRRLLAHRPPEPARPAVEVEGLLQVFPEGYGFLRRAEYGWMAATSDPCVPPSIVSDLGLATGHWLTAKARPPREGEKYAEVTEVLAVNHEDPEEAGEVEPFDRLVVTHPDHRFLLETEPEQVSMRMMDLFCPLGRGQRALVVSPPRAGKTLLLQAIADSLARNSPEVDIIVLLIDERPEEVTNMRRSVRGEVFASTFDQPAFRHIRLAELVLEKAKRMVEFGRHVVLLLDSLTRLGRAYNNESLETGRLLTGGLEASALTKPKAFFGAARNIEHGGSLTIVASALVDTGSRLDQVIFEEFKGTGNMEIALSRDLANRRLWPAIDIPRSGTRKEDLLLHPEELRRVTILRRAMAGAEAPEVLTDLLQKMVKHKSNAELLMNVQG